MPPKSYGRQAPDKTTKSVSMEIEVVEWLEVASKEVGASFSALLNDFLRYQIEAGRGASDLRSYIGVRMKTKKDIDEYFNTIPLHHAAAGEPASSDVDTWSSAKRLPGKGRIACRLHGDSMEPTLKNGSVVILRDKDSLKNPTLKKGEVYLFVVDGDKTLKEWQSRFATPAEIKEELTYVSPKTGKHKVPVLRSHNPDYPDIPVTPDTEWLAWYDPKDNEPHPTAGKYTTIGLSKEDAQKAESELRS